MSERHERFDRAAALFDTVDALICVTDPSGRILQFNRKCESVTDYSAEEIVGRSVLETLIPIEQRADVAAVLEDLQESGSNRFENDWVTRHGESRRIVWTNTNVADQDGRVREIIGTGIDVTEQRVLESRLAQSDRLDSVGRLAAGLAHDISNTLTTLCLRVERLSARDHDPDSRADLEAIARIIGRKQHLINDLLSFSGRNQQTPVRIDLNVELTRQATALADLLGSGIEIGFDLTSDDTTVLVDRIGLEQVLANLATNARHAMPDGGTVTVSTAVEEIENRTAPGRPARGAFDPGCHVVTAIADTGNGIHADDLPRVFDPYFTTKQPGQGTGLGLATAYGIITQAGGALTVASHPGAGTTFYMWLPHADPAPDG